jgi:hypothetical protein
MPRYFFHVRKGDQLIPDHEGAAFEDFEAAKAEAIHCCRDVAVDEIQRGGLVEFSTIEIADESGETLDRIYTRELFGV